MLEVPYTPGFRARSLWHYGKIRVPPKATPKKPCPVIMYLHGGFWKPKWNLHSLPSDNLMHAFGEDTATWEVEYSLVDQEDPSSSEQEGGWPFTPLDALSALNSLADGTLPAELQKCLDLERVYLCGHSAGGHLALWLAYFSRLDEPQRVELSCAIEAVAGVSAANHARAGVRSEISIAGVIGLAPIVNLRSAAAEGISDFHDAPINFLWRAGEAAHSAASAIAGGLSPLVTTPHLTRHSVPPSFPLHSPPSQPHALQRFASLCDQWPPISSRSLRYSSTVFVMRMFQPKLLFTLPTSLGQLNRSTPSGCCCCPKRTTTSSRDSAISPSRRTRQAGLSSPRRSQPL